MTMLGMSLGKRLHVDDDAASRIDIGLVGVIVRVD